MTTVYHSIMSILGGSLTALMMAARSGRTELVDILLTGENINIDYQIVSHSARERPS